MLQGRRGENDLFLHHLEGVQIYHLHQGQPSKNATRMVVHQPVQEARTVVDVRLGLSPVRVIGQYRLTSGHHQAIRQL